MTYENVKRLHKAYLECGADAPRLDLERWYPDLAEKPKSEPTTLTPAQKAAATRARKKAEAEAKEKLKDEK